MTGLYYAIVFFISLILTGIYVYMWHSHFSVNISLIFAFIPFTGIGYFFRERAVNCEEYILATKIIYLGGCFLILFTMLNVFDMCRIVIPRWVRLTCVIASAVVYISALSIGIVPIFYKEISAEMTDAGLVVTKSYGPFHTVFFALVIIYFLLSFGVMVYSFVKKKDVSVRTVVLLFIPVALSVVSFFVGKLSGESYDPTPASYALAQVMYLLIAHRMCLYDIAETSIDSIIETGDTGFLTVDFEMRYLGSNQFARDVFEELKDIRVDSSIKDSPTLWGKLGPWIYNYSQSSVHDKYYMEADDKVYLMDINYLYDEKKKKGYQIVISDDTRNQKYIRMMDSYNADLEREVEKKTADIVKGNNNLIKSMAMLVESRDNSTGGHIVRTSDVVEILMDEIMKDTEFTTKMGIDERFRNGLIKAAPLHDIGKIAVDDAVLRKPGKFTDEEYAKMKKHSEEGARVLHAILADIDDEYFRNLAENVAHFHHERMDGSGYPEGRKGEEIPIEARIMAIADVYDALVSSRVYKEAMSFDKADEIIRESMGRHFDSGLARFYLAARPRIEEYYIKHR